MSSPLESNTPITVPDGLPTVEHITASASANWNTSAAQEAYAPPSASAYTSIFSTAIDCSLFQNATDCALFSNVPADAIAPPSAAPPPALDTSAAAPQEQLPAGSSTASSGTDSSSSGGNSSSAGDGTSQNSAQQQPSGGDVSNTSSGSSTPALGDSPADDVAKMIIANESGSNASACIIDSNGVPSVGLFQANQQGDLPSLLQAYATSPGGLPELTKLFGGKDASIFANDPSQTASLSLNGDLSQFQQLCSNPAFQTTELTYLHHQVDQAASIAAQYGITSSEGVAIVADAINQFGDSGALQYLSAAKSAQDQQGKITAIVQSLQTTQYGGRYERDVQNASEYGLSADKSFSG